MNDQLSFDLTLIRVHCFTCPHVVESTCPEDAHTQMERHYRDRHAVLIARLVAS